MTQHIFKSSVWLVLAGMISTVPGFSQCYKLPGQPGVRCGPIDSLLKNGAMKDASGAIYGWGYTFLADSPVTPGAYQTQFPINGHQCSGCETGYVAKLNATGDTIIWATFIGGSSRTLVYSLALDSRGNVWVEGLTNSADFPITANALQTSPAPTFVAELSPDGSQLLYSTFLGSNYDVGYRISIDTHDGVYIVGEFQAPIGDSQAVSFAATPGAYKSQPTPGAVDLYVRKFDPTTNTLVYSTLIGPTRNPLDYQTTWGLVAIPDENGVLYVSYSTHRPEYPVTPDVYSHRSQGQDVLLTALNPTGTDLVFSTVIGGSGDDYATGMLRDSAGNIYLTGTTGGEHDPLVVGSLPVSPDFPVTPDAMQASWGPSFLMKLSPDASKLLYSTFVGKSGLGTVLDLAFPQQIELDTTGKIQMLVYSEESDIPLAPDSFNPCYPDITTSRLGNAEVYYPRHWVYLRFSDNLRSIEYATAVPDRDSSNYAYGPYYFDTSGNVYLTSMSADRYFDVVNVSAAPHPGPVCLAESVTKTLGPVAPGLLVSIYGPGIGPEEPAWGVPAAGIIPSQLAGVQVVFDNLPAPILYAGPAQIDVVVPFGVTTSGTTTVSVLRDGNLVGTLTNTTYLANPWLFSVDGTGCGASAWNQDGTPNSPTNPAHSGEIVTYYAMGTGAITPVLPDGTVPTAPTAVPVNSLGFYGDCSYIGDAPGQVEGVIQANCRVTLGSYGAVQPVVISVAPQVFSLRIHNVIYVQ